MLSQTDANPPCQNTPLPVYNHRTGTRSPTGLLQTKQQTHQAHSGKMLLPEAAVNEPSLTWWPPESGDPALCHTGAVRDRGGVCRTTSLTHGVREGGPDTSGRKTARGNTDRRMQSFITQWGEGRGKTNKKRKATKSKGRGLEEGASRALMRQVGEEGCGGRVSHNRYNVSSVPQAALEDPEG